MVQAKDITTKLPRKGSNPLPQCSAEQEKVLDALQIGNNVQIIAVAGYGKTTTILHIAKKFPMLKILALTYNVKISTDTKLRVKELRLKNLQVSTYHAFAYRHLSPEARTNVGLARDEPLHSIFNYDIICLDEQQDMNIYSYKFVQKVIKANIGCSSKMGPQYVILGDPYQEIYAYEGARHQFLTLADKAFPSPREWTKIVHDTSYRFGHGIANFINTQTPRYPPFNFPIRTIKEGKRPEYHLCKSVHDLKGYITKMLEEDKISPDDILVLAPSIREGRKSAPVRLGNALGRKIPIYFPTPGEDLQTDRAVENTRGKIVFSTFHQAKGIQRDYVFVLNFDMSYVKFYGGSPGSFISHQLYVAITRAKEKLILVHERNSPFLPFLNPATLSETCDVVLPEEWKNNEDWYKNVAKEKQVDEVRRPQLLRDIFGSESGQPQRLTDLVRHLNVPISELCFSKLKLTQITEPKPTIKKEPRYIQIYGIQEKVTDITGVAIPAIHQLRTAKKSTLLSWIQHLVRNSESHGLSDRTKELLAELKTKDLLNTPKILFLANVAIAILSGYTNRLDFFNVESYNWLSDEVIAAAMSVLSKHISPSAEYELKLLYKNSETAVCGFGDVKDKDNFFELKWKDKPEKDDVLQLALYAAVDQMSSKPNLPPRRYFLLYVPIDLKIEVQGDFQEVLRLLLQHSKAENNGAVSDSEFMADLAAGFPHAPPDSIPKWFTELGQWSPAGTQTKNSTTYSKRKYHRVYKA